ncbi:MAG: metallopeptidase TldD-related protein [Elusimicrobiota bacterium]|jgi:hypothetical protein
MTPSLRTPALLLLILLSPSARSAEPVDRVFDAMQDELNRTTSRLEMDKMGKPYFVAVTVQDDDRIEIEGSFGALKNPNEQRSRSARVLLRVGNRTFDNAHYVGRDYWRYQPFTNSAPVEDDYDALRAALWTTADQAYKQALEKLSQKTAYQHGRNITDALPDLTKDEVFASSQAPTAQGLDRALWEERVRKLSAVFRLYPAIQRSSVQLSYVRRAIRLLDSEGRRILRPADFIEMNFNASGQAADGIPVQDRRLILRRKASEMPDFSSLEGEARALAGDVTALCSARQAEAYLGPVLLEGQASGEFLNQLFARSISFPRELWIENEESKEFFSHGEFSSRLGLRVISPLFDVYDDPGARESAGAPLAGSYDFDAEGMPGRKVLLAQKGILKDLLMSRSPIKDRNASNGHGRGTLWEFPEAQISNLFFEPSETMSEAELKQELRKRASEFGLSHGLIIRRISEAAPEKEGALAAPILVYRVDVKTGKEELVRNAEFSGASLRSLRDIAAASDRRRVHDCWRVGIYRYNHGRVPASIIAPSVLISEMELKKSEQKPQKPPVLKHPYFDKQP